MNKVLTLALVAFVATASQAAVEDTNQATTAIQTETVQVEQVAPKQETKKVGVVLETENYKGQATNQYKGDAVADEKLEVKYKLTDRDSVSVAQEWSRSYESKEHTHTKLMDTSLRYTRSGYKLPSEVSYAAQGRVYIPTATSSQDAGQITQLRLYNMFSMPVAKNLEATLLVNPRLFVYDNSGVDEAKSKRFRILNSAGLKYAVTEKVALEQTIGIYSKWVNGTDRADNLDASTSVYYTPVSWLDLNAGIRQSDDASNTRVSGAGLYKSKQSEYYLIASFNM